MKELLSQLLRHMEWADERTVASLRSLPEPPPENAIRIFGHLVTSERIHLARMRREDPFPQNFWPELSLDEGASVAATAVEGWTALIAGHHMGDLNRPVRYRNSSGRYFETAPSQMLIHLATHGEHHRGQIARMVREAGGQPAVTDLLDFLRESSDEENLESGRRE